MALEGCERVIFGLCLTRAPAETGFAIFGFAEFLAALALLVLVFSSSDFLYQFRVSVAPIPLKLISFVATVTIGAGTLLTDVWFAEQWYSLPWGFSRASIQAFFGAMFLTTVLLWIWFAYIRPPVFNKWNSKHFYGAVFRTIVRGSDVQLAVLAAEMIRSAETLVEHSGERIRDDDDETASTPQRLARSTMTMMGNRKFCRHIVSSSPVTAIVFAQEVSRREKHSTPLGGFFRNVTTEALLNRDSILFHEETYGRDVLGRVQPFSKALYGDYRLVEGAALTFDSPLDLDWKVAWEMDGDQFEAYCRATLLTFNDYVKTGEYQMHSYALYRAFGVIKDAGRDLYRLNGQASDASDRTPVRRLSAAVEFINEAIKFLGEQDDLNLGRLRNPRGGVGSRDGIFDWLADMMYDLLLAASSVRSPNANAWSIQYNAFWGRLLAHPQESEAWNVVRFKFYRRVFDEIKRLETFPNFEGSRILGICLNVMGLSVPKRDQRSDSEYALHKAVLEWTRRNYLELTKVHPPVAEDCLLGGISFDRRRKRIVKTYEQGLRLKPSRAYLDLERGKKRSCQLLD